MTAAIKKKKKKKWKSLDIALLLLGSFLVLFIAAVLYVFLKVGMEPVELVKAVTAATLAEIFACMAIKLDNNKRKGKEKKDGAEE